MTEVDLPVFESGLESTIDGYWEPEQEYDSYTVDNTILQARSDILALIDSSYSGGRIDHWSKKRRHEAHEAVELLDARDEELLGRMTTQSEMDTRGHSSYDRVRNRDAYGKMLRRVLEEWTKHYFLPRTEAVNVTAYDEWLADRIQYGGAKKVRLDYTSDQPGVLDRFYRALSPIRLVPMWGSEAVRLIAPPGVEVGGPGNTHVYRWDDLSHSGPSKNSFDVYPSTRELLEARALLPAPEKPLDAELRLRARAAEWD